MLTTLDQTSRHTLLVRGRTIDVGWCADRRVFFADIYEGERGSALLQSIGARTPVRIRSIDALEAWLGEYGPLPLYLRARLLEDEAATIR